MVLGKQCTPPSAPLTPDGGYDYGIDDVYCAGIDYVYDYGIDYVYDYGIDYVYDVFLLDLLHR